MRVSFQWIASVARVWRSQAPAESVGRDRIRLFLLQKTRSAAGATDRRAIDGAGLRFCSTSKDYIVGPMMELGLPFHLSVEIDGLYRPLNFTSAAVNPDGSLNSVLPATVVTWEFPVLAKY